MDSYRTLRIYGNKTSDASYTVTVNGEVVDHGKNELFSFITNTKVHGSCSVAISVQTGNIILTNCTATYPALFNGINGTATFVQPIESPVAIVENKKIKIIPFEISIKAGETFVYEHLMFNGPTRFNITTNNIDLFPGVDVYIGDFLTNTISQNVLGIRDEYEYTQFPNQLTFENLEKLKEIVALGS